MADAILEVFRGDQQGSKTVRYNGAHRARHGRPGRPALHSGPPGARSGGALELQGRQVRLLLGGGQRPPAPDVQDAHGCPPARPAHHRVSHEILPGDQRRGDRCLLELQSETKKIPPFTPRPGVEWKFYQDDVDRVQEFRKCIECFLCQNVCHVLREHGKMAQFGRAAVLLRAWSALKCIPSTGCPACPCGDGEMGLGLCATLPSAAPKSAPRKFTSPTTPLSRSRNALWISSTTP